MSLTKKNVIEEVSQESKFVCISISELYAQKGQTLSQTFIDYSVEDKDNQDFYDLLTDSSGIILCMDGEECEIVSKTAVDVRLRNIYSNLPFTLSKEEYEIATFTRKENLKNFATAKNTMLQEIDEAAEDLDLD